MPSPPIGEDRLASFDGGVVEDVAVALPERYRELEGLGEGQWIPRGAGVSYAAASFGRGATSLDMARFDRLLGFDPEAGTLEVEAGCSLGKVAAFLGPRGHHLAIQPGHPVITVGGCIGSDVHGKNQYREGTFREQVARLTLFHPDHGFRQLDPDGEPELFDLTVGGFGLTGVVVAATLRVTPLPRGGATLRRHPIGSHAEALERLTELREQADFLYTHQDFNRRGDAWGRGEIIAGTLAEDGPAPSEARTSWRHPADFSPRGSAWALPFFNAWTTPLFHRGLALAHALQSRTRQTPLQEALFPVVGKEAYFRLFGRRGFHELQVLVPEEAAVAFFQDLQGALDRHRVPVTLASLKAFRGRVDLLRFSGDGVCVALNFPRSRRALEFCAEADAICIQHRCRVNLAKDSRLPAGVARQLFPELERFRELRRKHDPELRFESELSRRLEL